MDFWWWPGGKRADGGYTRSPDVVCRTVQERQPIGATGVSLRQTLSSCWSSIQHDLFPWLEERVGPLSAPHQDLVKVLEMARIEAFVPHGHGLVGRPPAERAALARAFVAKAVFNLTTTTMLIERVMTDKILRRLCGWERTNEIPSEATFSRAFAEFAASALPSQVHEALIARTQKDRLVGHISRDSTAIEVLIAGSAAIRNKQRLSRMGPFEPRRRPRRRAISRRHGGCRGMAGQTASWPFVAGN